MVTLFLILGLNSCKEEEQPLPDDGNNTELSDTTDRADSNSSFPEKSCEDELHILTTNLTTALTHAPSDTGFTLLLEKSSGEQFSFTQGVSSATTSYQSASTSKLVAAAVILDAVKEGKLSLDSKPQDFISYWPKEGTLSDITLRDLLSFSSGLSKRALCTDSKFYNFSNCVENIMNNNLEVSEASGESFYYGPNHLQVAGLMTLRALNMESWGEVFDAFKAKTGLFSHGVFDLPSIKNPRIAGGMHWQGDEYFAFLKALYHRNILNDNLITQMFSDQISSAKIDNSPALDSINEDWHYGFGNWIECHQNPYSCSEVKMISSPGAYGAYPFISYEKSYFGILAREGALGTFTKGYTTFQSVFT
jgi:hypothetical protein